MVEWEQELGETTMSSEQRAFFRIFERAWRTLPWGRWLGKITRADVYVRYWPGGNVFETQNPDELCISGPDFIRLNEPDKEDQTAMKQMMAYRGRMKL
jgi:hypothetical protein